MDSEISVKSNIIEYKHHETFKGDKIEERIFKNSRLKNQFMVIRI